MDIVIEWAWWIVRGSGFALGWIISNALVDLLRGRRAP